MTVEIVMVTALVSVTIGFFSADFYKRRGYPFWKTFIVGSIAFFGVAMMLIAAISGNAEP